MTHPKEVLTEAEQKFEDMRAKVGFVTSPLVFLIIYFMPMPSLTDNAHKLFAVVGFVLVLWLTESVPIPVAALIGAVLNVLIGVAPAKEVMAPFAHPLVFLFIGGFILAESIMHHKLDKRFSFAILSVDFLIKNPMRILLAFGIISGVSSMWISNTSTTAMMLPIGIGVLHAMREAGRQEGGGLTDSEYKKFATALMLMIAYGSSVGGIATPIGTAPNVIGIGMIDSLVGVKITFFEWMVFALPMASAMMVYLFFVLKFGINASHSMKGAKGYIREKAKELGSWKRGEVNTLIAFGVAIFLWVLPSALKLTLGGESEVFLLAKSRLNTGVVALFAASLLFILPLSRKSSDSGALKFTMTWDRAVRIDWGTILLFGGGISLGTLMFSTGLADAFGTNLTSLTGATTLWTVTAVSIAMAIILSETTSNTASANMLIPVVIAISQSMGINPLPPAIGATIAASYGFMLPVSTPPNAIVYGSGMVNILTMVKRGIFFDIGGFVIILLGLMLMAPFLGWV